MSASWFERFVRGTGFLQRYPFYAGVLSQLDVVCTEAIAVMAVRCRHGRFTLLVNERYFADRPQYRAGVLLHEVHHIVLGHLVQPRFHDAAQPLLMQLALEMSANEYIAEPLPDPIVWRDFTWVGVGPDQSTVQRYHWLCRFQQRLELQLACLPGWLDDHGDGGPDRHGASIGPLVSGEATADGAHAALRLLIERAALMAPQLARLGGTAPDDPQQHLALLGDRSIDSVLRELGPASPCASLDWRAQLRRFVRRQPARIWHRPDRRQPQRLFEVPGRGRVRTQPRILVAIDTSGSITDEELGAIARELDQLAAQAVITVAECDCRILNLYPYRGRIHSVRGNGATDLRPPFATELLDQHGRDGAVYFTDGQGPWPTQRPAVPVLWVLVQGLPFECPWGARVRLQVGAPEAVELPS